MRTERKLDGNDNPYAAQPARAFWRTAVTGRAPAEISEVYAPGFEITKDMAIATAGSCFAQHIGRHFKRRGYNVLDVEPPPPGLAPRTEEFGFDLYSARYGNIYTARQLRQLFQRAHRRFFPRETAWERDGRFFDPYRPSVEPNGFTSAAELKNDTAHHLKLVRTLLTRTDLFVFTFGLTEAWVSKWDDAAFAVCPGTIAGRFDDRLHRFHNFTYEETLKDAEAFIKFALRRNRRMKFLLTVSPVPLTATASGQHVLPAIVHAKSILRTVCGALTAKYRQVDYFPSYELIASHPMRGRFFEGNKRSISKAGVAHAMNSFFAAHDEPTVDSDLAPLPRATPAAEGQEAADNVICDDEIIEAFGP